jgi:hypothetical protein
MTGERDRPHTGEEAINSYVYHADFVTSINRMLREREQWGSPR